jgi:NADPH:quinone reductase-like Zn-dependent oxidoreductase
MKTIQAAHRGSYDALRLVGIPRPQSRAGQALVRVTSAGVAPLDRTVLAGLHPTARKLPLVPCNEGAGVVIEDPSRALPGRGAGAVLRQPRRRHRGRHLRRDCLGAEREPRAAARRDTG